METDVIDLESWVESAIPPRLCSWLVGENPGRHWRCAGPATGSSRYCELHADWRRFPFVTPAYFVVSDPGTVGE